MDMLTTYTGTTYGLYMWYCYDQMEITSNKIATNKTLGFHYGAYLGQCIGLNNKKGLVANNFIAINNPTNTSGTYGIYSTGNTYLDIVNNNFYIAHNATNAYGLYLTGGGNHNLLNNNIVLKNLGYGIYISTVASVANSNHNNLFAPNGNVGYYNGVMHTSFNDWQNNTGFDANGISINPLYTDSLDLHTCEMSLAGTGVYNSAVTDDIDGQLRNQNKPYIGADLFMDLNADLLGGNQSKCPQDAVQLQVVADPNETTSYLWQPGGLTTPTISASNAGWYYVTVTTGCGTATDSVEITNEPLPVASFNITTTNQLTAVFADASTNATTWNWNFGDGNTSTQQNPFHIYNQSGTYTVTLIVCNDCGCDTTTQEVTVLANSVDENFLSNVVSIYPNPNKGEFTISMNGVASALIEISTVQGKIVYTENLNTNGSINKNINLNQASGMYFVKIVANEQTMVTKVIIE
jgi:PKD repeat protein